MQDGMVRMIGPRDEVLARVMPNGVAADSARSDTIQPGDSEITPQKPAQPATDTAADTAGQSTVNPTAKGDVSFG